MEFSPAECATLRLALDSAIEKETFALAKLANVPCRDVYEVVRTRERLLKYYLELQAKLRQPAPVPSASQ